MREALVDFLQREHAEALPRMRAEFERAHKPLTHAPAPPPVRAGKGDSSAIKEPTHAEVQAVRDSRAPADVQNG